MTYAKFGQEFCDECADAGLSDAAFRTHTEAIGFLYRIESYEMRIKKHLVQRFAGSSEWRAAVAELVKVGFWRDVGSEYLVEHHGDVFRGSLVAQQKARHRNRKSQQTFREKARSGSDISDYVSDYPVSQTDSLEEEAQSEERIDWVTGEVFSSSASSSSSSDASADIPVCDHQRTTALEVQRDMCNRCWTKADGAKKMAALGWAT